MDINPYDNAQIPWTVQQQTFSPPVRQARRVEQSPSARPRQSKPAKMPKEKALALVRSLKKGLIVASVIGFGTFSWLVANHQVGNTASAASTSSATATPTQSTQSTQSNSGNFFSQQDNGQQSNSSQQGGGYGFGSSQSSQSPVSSSTVS